MFSLCKPHNMFSVYVDFMTFFYLLKKRENNKAHKLTSNIPQLIMGR